MTLEEKTTRLDALIDKKAAHAFLNPDVPNADLWIKQNILDASDADAELNLSNLEQADVDFNAIEQPKINREIVREKGKLAKKACDNALAVINGYGQDLTQSEEDQLLLDHSAAFQLLQFNKAWTFKAYIEAIDTSADAVITDEMKQTILDQLIEDGI